MNNRDSIAVISVLVGLLLMTACSSQPGRNYTETGLQETLETEILPDTSKMFTYRLRLPDGAVPSHIRVVQGNSRAVPAGAGIEINRTTSRRLLENTGYVVENLGYCRTGFLTLDQRVSRYHLWLKGECREGATADDIERFGRENTLTVPTAPR